MKIKVLAFVITAAFVVYGITVYVGAERPQDGAGAASLARVQIDASPIDRESVTVVTSYADALERVRPAVVSIYSTRTVRQRSSGFPFNDPFFDHFFGRRPQQERERIQRGLGSGVIVSDDGYILTNNHVIDGADEIRVALADNREVQATLVGSDPMTDVAVLKIEVDEMPTAVLGDSDGLRVGDIAFAVGNPLGVGQTVTMGIISATGRSQMGILGRDGYENFIQTDAAINRGNSGGALVDAHGRVIGINTAIISTSQGNIGIGFAIPINLAYNVMQSLIESGRVVRGFLGVGIQDLDPDLAEGLGIAGRRGALVTSVNPDSPAEEAGVQQGDVIVAVNNRRVESTSDLRLTISQIPPDSVVTLRVIRRGEPLEVEARLGRLDEGLAASGAPGELMDGIRVAPVSDELREELRLGSRAEGLVVVEVEERSRYAQAFPVGTIIEEINQQRVRSLTEAREALRPGRNVFLVNQRGVHRFLAVTINP
ncbi:MAG: DegQ family serine endoprotease [Puniceicoccaceae bacterium]|nr:MAG: DegQ family serine endoprotease [Puniceicoccaceae bacterium]